MKTGNPKIDNSKSEWIIGSDEVGYGTWAGPLVVAGTALPRGWVGDAGDSKKLTPSRRRQIFDRYTSTMPVIRHVEVIPVERVDEIGVGQALYEGHRTTLEALLARVSGTTLVVVDGFQEGLVGLVGVPGAIGLPRADHLVPAVSLASIIAKVTFDTLMDKYADKYPGYGFGRHRGYGTADHRAALDKLGPCPIHRKSYTPIAARLADVPGLEVDANGAVEERLELLLGKN